MRLCLLLPLVLLATAATLAVAARAPALTPTTPRLPSPSPSPTPPRSPSSPSPASSVAPAWTWEHVNASVIYGDDYKNASGTIVYAGTVAAEDECRAICGNWSACQAYDYAYETRPGEPACDFLRQCWLRLDTVWQPKAGAHCIKGAARKIAPPPAPPANAKHVLFIIFDDLRAIHKTYGFTQVLNTHVLYNYIFPFSCMYTNTSPLPHPQPYTPRTDAFAKQSLVFDRAFCQQAVCGPSRASLLSGRRPDRTQMWNFIGGFRETPGANAWNTWPEYFKKQGWWSAGAGKLFHPGDPKDFDPPSWSEPLDQTKFPYFGQVGCVLGV